MSFRGRVAGRAILRLKGPNAGEFLQGMITSDLNSIAENNRVGHGCFLNSKGRVLFDALVAHNPSTLDCGDLNDINNDTFLLDVDERITEYLADHIEEFRLRAKFALEDVTSQVSLVVGSGDSCSLPDPRTPLASVTSREYVPAAAAADLPEVSSEYYAKLFEQGVGEGPEVFVPEKTLPFQGGVDLTGGVSFEKGCYLGQELTHRTHIMLVTRKRLVPVKFASVPSQGLDLLGSSIRTTTDGQKWKKNGELVGISGAVGLAMLRLDAFAVRNADHSVAEVKSEVACECNAAEGPAANGTLSVPSWWTPDVLSKALVS